MFDENQIPNHHKRTALERDRHMCRFCGTDTGDLHLHHIIPISEGGSNYPENLTTTCASCHRWIHGLFELQEMTTNIGTTYNPSPLDLLVVLNLGQHAPARTQTLATRTYASIPSVTDRLYKLAALNVVEPTGAIHEAGAPTEWHFRGNVASEDSPIGSLPDDAKKAAMLTRDEMIRQRVQNGESTNEVAADLGLSRRTVYKSVDRAAALEPPVPNIHQQTTNRETHSDD